MKQIQVLWDGRRNGPGGAYLCTDEHPIVQPEPLKPRKPVVVNTIPVIDQVVQVLMERPSTLREIAEMRGLYGPNVNAALYQLRQRGLVEVIGGSERKSIYALVQERN